MSINIQEKSRLHSRNKNRVRYDLAALVSANQELKAFIKPNKFGDDSVDFSNPQAVKTLNRSLLKYYYGIEYWEFPDENLCPPIPGRADYIHYIADLLAESNFGRIPTGNKITCLDIGTGATCIYPIIGVVEYQWKFIGTDINSNSLTAAKKIIASNELLESHIECKLQKRTKNIFRGILEKTNPVDLTICNPPFHESIQEAEKGTSRKIKNLSGVKEKKPVLNFSGNNNELVCEGGESQFLETMIRESKTKAKSCFWFSSLVSKKSNLKKVYKILESLKAVAVKTIPMGTANKTSRIVAWTFLTKEEQKEWKATRWQ